MRSSDNIDRHKPNQTISMTPTPSPPRKETSGGWLSLIIWLTLALLIRWQVVEPRWIPSGSMLPTLELQDRILVEKLRPRLTRQQQHPLPLGSVVVFHPPSPLIDAGYDPKAALIKRVVGLPGDHLEVHDGQLWRNKTALQNDWRETAMDYEMAEVTVPEHEIWVMGDNRNVSLDSHIWGSLPEEEVIGTAIWRYWPLNRFGPIRFPSQEKSGSNHLAAIGFAS
jgi:signal peptidase I|tara:strand:- start:589 stop:1260 length:672 start_codon:yes stop_codon:yes gene_type:complete